MQRDGGPGHLRGKDTRPSRLWLLAVLLVLVVPIVATAVYYDPLEQGGEGTCPEGSQAATDATGENETCFVNFAEGLRLRYGVALRNSGPLPVEVASVPALELGELAVLDQAFTAVSSHQEPVPFAPFSLDGNEERLVLAEIELRSCAVLGGDTLVEITDLTVQQRFLGLTRRVSIPLTTSVSIVVQNCP